jgi:hypothetical protein
LGNEESEDLELLQRINFFRTPVLSFTLDSNTNSVNGTKALLRINFNPPLQIASHKKHFLNMNFLRLPITVPNISDNIGNNEFKLFEYNGAVLNNSWVFTIPDGTYTVEAINAYLQSQLLNLGIALPNNTPPWTALEIFANENTGLCLVTNYGISPATSFTYSIDFSINNSTLYDTLGLPTGELKVSTVGTKDVDIYGDNSTVFVRSNLASNYSTNVEDNVMFITGWTGETYGAQTHRDENILPLSNTYYREVPYVEVRVTNVNNELLDFRGTSKDSNIICKINIVA